MASKRKLVGMSGGEGEGAYKPLATAMTNLTRGVARPIPGSDINRDSVVEFHVTARPGTMIRFDADCVSLLADIKVKNKAFDAGGATDLIRAEWHHLVPSKVAPHLFVDSAVGGGAFFSHVEVEVNQYPVGESKLGTNGWLWNVWNRTFCSAEKQVLRYGRKIPRISTEHARKHTNIATSDDLRATLEEMDSEGGQVTSVPRLFRFSPDGVYPFDQQSNATRNCTGQVNENAFHPGGTAFVFRFHKRDPLTALFQNAATAESTYNDPASVTADPAVYSFEVTFRQMEISYEILTLPEALASEPRDPRKKKKKLRCSFFTDVPRIYSAAMGVGQQVTTNVVQVAPGTRFVGLTWMLSHQIYHSSSQKKAMRGNFHMPPGARLMTVELDGKPMIFERGLVNSGVAVDAHKSRTCMELHQYLTGKQLYSKSFGTLFPPNGAGYDQCIMIDLSDRVISKPAQLEVEVVYQQTSAPGWYLVAFSVQQYKYTLEEESPVDAKLVI